VARWTNFGVLCKAKAINAGLGMQLNGKGNLFLQKYFPKKSNSKIAVLSMFKPIFTFFQLVL
jgi:hypothetical protein